MKFFLVKDGVGRLIQARLIVPNVVEYGAGMEMVYRKRWEAEIAQMRRLLAGFCDEGEVKKG